MRKSQYFSLFNLEQSRLVSLKKITTGKFKTHLVHLEPFFSSTCCMEVGAIDTYPPDATKHPDNASKKTDTNFT